MADDHKPPIIVKRIKKTAGGHHGGAWKIAYADFVTAMMAFFLLMWLLGSVTKGDLQGIADYFNTPLKVALEGGSGSGDSSSVLKGGGKDLTRSEGQVQKTATPTDRRTINLQAAKAELERQEKVRLGELRARIDAAIAANPLLKQYSQQIKVEITPDGLRVQIQDEQNRPMFDSGSATLKPYTREILQELGKLMNDVPNRISLAGHTDSTQYAAGERGYSNWELSADRANASRRELVAGGIAETKIIRVEGLGEAVMADPNNPKNPINRRITIMVLNQQALLRILGKSDAANAETAEEAARAAAATAEAAPAAAQPPAATPTAAPQVH
ncbi:MAG: flagellar motor protein MotB [Burkholderiales bacterium]